MIMVLVLSAMGVSPDKGSEARLAFVASAKLISKVVINRVGFFIVITSLLVVGCWLLFVVSTLPKEVGGRR